MALFFFLGSARDFPLAPFFIPELMKIRWEEDFRVVSKTAYSNFIEQIPSGFTASQKMLKARELERIIGEKRFDFSEASYLAANSDIADAIDSKKFRSGFHHYLAFGAAENRAAELRVPLEVDGETLSVKIVTDNDPQAEFPKDASHCIQMASINDYQSIAGAIPYADKKIKSSVLHQIFFCEPWLAYDLAWNICRKSTEEETKTKNQIIATLT